MGAERVAFRTVFAICLLSAAWRAGNAAAETIRVSTVVQLEFACEHAVAGDTIVMEPGTYRLVKAGGIRMVGRPGPITVRGATGVPGDVIVTGAGQDDESVGTIFTLDDSPYWTFRDFTTRDTFTYGFKFDRGSAYCELHNLVMRDHGSAAVKGTSDPASGRHPDGLVIDGCDIGYSRASGGTRGVVEGVDGVGVKDWAIRRSRFVNIQRGGGDAYGVFTKGNASGTIIEANRFENCFVGASFGGGGTGSQWFRGFDGQYEHSGGVIRNNLFLRGTDAAVYINKGRNSTVAHNTVFDCALTIQFRFPESSGQAINNLVLRSASNPKEPLVRLREGPGPVIQAGNRAALYLDFVEPFGPLAGIDLHLRPGSLAVDAGTNAAMYVDTDWEGDPRPRGRGYDVGADEQ